MKTWLGFLTLAAGLAFGAASFAQAPAGAPTGATGLCNDGTYYMGATKQGACRGHKGVKDWYAAAAPASAVGGAGSVAPPPAPAALPPPPPAPTAGSAMSKRKAVYTPPANAAPGGGPGMVWANDTTKVYHCQGDRYYGKTKHGEYMTEADAKAKSFRPDHGKACQ